jgi:PAS domain S-box-containing protein
MASIHPEDRSRVQAAIDRALQTGDGYTMEHRVIRADGNERIVLERGEVLANDTGHASCLRGTVQDVTTSSQQITTIQTQSIQIDKQADLLDSAHDMITVFDLDGHLLYWNHGAAWTYGWTREEAMGKIGHHLLKTEFSTPLVAIVSDILREGKWEGELIQHDRQGGRLSVESRWVLRRDSHEHPEAILAIDRDITLRKQAEETVKQARDYAENIIATIQDALIVLDNTLQAISANESFYQTFALTPDEVVGTPIYHLPGGRWDQPDLRRLLEDILPRKTQLRNFELTYSEPGHPDRYLLLNARQIQSQAYPQELILLAIQDITQRKAQDRAIAAHERRLHALTEELLQAEEAQREKTALALHDSIGPALAFAKRELSALEKEAAPNWRDNLRRVNHQISKAIQQTRSLTTELSSPTLRVFGLEAAIEELGDQFATEHNLKCTTLYPEETIPITPNHRTFLYRAVRELLINIVKHAQATQVTIAIERDQTDIEISVEDNGQGFDPACLANHQGNALQAFGLFSIQERLDYIGGHFKLETHRHEGTRIILRAPIADNRKGDRHHGTNLTRG